MEVIAFNYEWEDAKEDRFGLQREGDDKSRGES